MIPDTSTPDVRARSIDGRAHAVAIRDTIKADVAQLVQGGKFPPGLGVILVGSNPASIAYVGSKTKACQAAGFHSVQHNLAGNATEEEVISWVESYNRDPRIHGILVQLPLPQHIDEQRVIDAIAPTKDVDGLHPQNAGLLALGRPRFVPCTPLGIRELLVREKVETRGRHVVIVGRSNLVGRPLATLLSLKGRGGDATVTLAHSATADLAAVTRSADILVVATGRARFVTGSMIRPGAVVIDVGINRVEEPKPILVGDVDFDSASRVASLITPVPGGVGPMTIAMLLRNTLESARRHQ